MTALHVVGTPDQIVVLSDAAWYLPNGTITRLSSKVRRHPDLPFAVAVTGNEDVAERFWATLCNPEHVGSLMQAADLLQVCVSYFAAREKYGAQRYPVAEIVIAGFDGHKMRVIVGHIGQHDKSVMPSRSAFKIIEIDPDEMGVAQFSRGPEMSLAGQSAFVDLQKRNMHLGVEFFRECGAKYFDIYRRSKSRSLTNSAEIYMVGGFVEHTRIMPHSVESTILHRWPDKIGAPISPEQE